MLLIYLLDQKKILKKLVEGRQFLSTLTTADIFPTLALRRQNIQHIRQ